MWPYGDFHLPETVAAVWKAEELAKEKAKEAAKIQK
jgi:hypothetical protein